MAKGDKFYFENFEASAALSKKAATYLVECLENYDPDNYLQQWIYEKKLAMDKEIDEISRKGGK